MASTKGSKSTKSTKSNGVKDIVYLDSEDEIAFIVSKVKASKSKIVALVLPRRIGALESPVNMKLLKKAAVLSKKNIVLITSSKHLVSLAGAAGVYVAETLKSKPAIPKSDAKASAGKNIEVEDFDPEESIGSLDAKYRGKNASTDDDVIEFNNIQTDDIDNEPKKARQSKKNKKLKVPNFEKFRLAIVLSFLGIFLLVGGGVLAFSVLPKSVISIKTDTSTAVSSFDFTADADLAEVDIEYNKLPAKKKEIKKVESEKSTATGERDEGTRARGNVTLSTSCVSGAPIMTTIPAGTAVSFNNMNYITQESAVLATPQGVGTDCVFTDTVKVLASENGDKFNLDSGKTFAVAGENKVKGVNSNSIDGGTSKVVKFVTQSDADKLISKIKEKLNDSVKDDLANDLEKDKLFPLRESFSSPDPEIKVTPDVNEEASEFSISYEVTYAMMGVKKDDLVELVRSNINGDIDFNKQSMVDDGIDSAIMHLNSSQDNKTLISIRTTVVAGPELDQDKIKKDIAGMKRGEVEKYIKDIDGVVDLNVEFSPFWVNKVPKSAKKIKIEIQKPESTTSGLLMEYSVES